MRQKFNYSWGNNQPHSPSNTTAMCNQERASYIVLSFLKKLKATQKQIGD